MFTKHFLKTLVFFTALIVIGLIGVFLVSYFDQNGSKSNPVDISNITKLKK